MTKIELSVKIPSSGLKSIKLKVDQNKDVNEIKDRILSNQQIKLPRQDKEGNVYKYFFTSKRLGKQISGTLASAGIVDGDTLIFHQEAVAG